MFTTADTSIEISEIMDSFDLTEVRKMIQEQLGALDDDPCDFIVDNFKILHQTYASVKKNREDLTDDEFAEVEDRFFDICEIFIEEICDKFGLSMDGEYMESHHRDLPAVCLCLYLFFVLEFKSNVYSVLRRFIKQNKDEIAQAFEEAKSKKDASTLANKSIEDETVALIVSNIYDIVEWTLEQITPDTYLEIVDKSVAYQTIQPLYEAGVLTGNFADEISDIMKSNIALRGRICFDLMCNLKGIEV